MLIEVWSDVACPFCYIGKRRFAAALAAFEHRDEVRVEWKSFLLNPDLRTDPHTHIADYLASAKGMDPAMVRQMNQRVGAMGADVGISFDFDRVVVANTRMAHRLLQAAQSLGDASAAQDALFHAYFEQGKNVDDPNVLREIGASLGLDAGTVESVLSGDAFDDLVDRDIFEARQLGISGVPFFVLDRAYGVSGAQETAVFTQALQQAFTARAAS